MEKDINVRQAFSESDFRSLYDTNLHFCNHLYMNKDDSNTYNKKTSHILQEPNSNIVLSLIIKLGKKASRYKTIGTLAYR